MKFIILIFFLSPFLAFSKTSFKVMSFNTMCKMCGKKNEYGKFKHRLDFLADTINRHNPELLSLQELTLRSEVYRLKRRLNKKYIPVYLQGTLSSFVDPVLFIDPKRYEIIDEDSFWLGPNKKLPFGWKLALPRRLQWVEIYDKARKESFIFTGTHFDNNSLNKNPSAQYVNKYFRNFNHPVLFAGDTNLKPSMEGYEFLTQDLFNNTFPGLSSVKFFHNQKFSIHDACMLKKGVVFPECRVDHILTSKNSSWKVKSWGVDLHKYTSKVGFASDHRAVIVELE